MLAFLFALHSRIQIFEFERFFKERSAVFERIRINGSGGYLLGYPLFLRTETLYVIFEFVRRRRRHRHGIGFRRQRRFLRGIVRSLCGFRAFRIADSGSVVRSIVFDKQKACDVFIAVYKNRFNVFVKRGIFIGCDFV